MAISTAMGRPKLPARKKQIGSRVAPGIKAAIEFIAKTERRTESQAIELLLEDSPKIQALMANHKRKPTNRAVE